MCVVCLRCVVCVCVVCVCGMCVCVVCVCMHAWSVRTAMFVVDHFISGGWAAVPAM